MHALIPRRRVVAARDRRAAAHPLACLLALALSPFPLTSCDDSTSNESAAAVTYGTPVTLGDGEARVYVVETDGAPNEVGVALSPSAFEGLPPDHGEGGMQMPDGHSTYGYVVPMPADHGTPYQFVLLHWNPAGHVPPGVYDVPHFDFHFYTISDAERMAIVPSDPEFAEKGARYPEAVFLPGPYEPIEGDLVPLMGAHWADPASPELNGQDFTQTFIYGTWDGALIFGEPMVTRAFLLSKPSARTPIATPAQYRTPGYYPSEYRVYWEPERNEYRVALSGLAPH
jgi:hypothetical protein